MQMEGNFMKPLLQGKIKAFENLRSMDGCMRVHVQQHIRACRHICSDIDGRIAKAKIDLQLLSREGK